MSKLIWWMFGNIRKKKLELFTEEAANQFEIRGAQQYASYYTEVNSIQGLGTDTTVDVYLTTYYSKPLPSDPEHDSGTYEDWHVTFVLFDAQYTDYTFTLYDSDERLIIENSKSLVFTQLERLYTNNNNYPEIKRLGWKLSTTYYQGYKSDFLEYDIITKRFIILEITDTTVSRVITRCKVYFNAPTIITI